MKIFTLFYMVLVITFGTFSGAMAQDITITAEDLATISASETPRWVHAFDKEVKSYHYTPEQSSLATLRATRAGNCVAFAKLGAWYALRDGYQCKFIGIASGTRGHMFLYATKGDTTWAVSNKSRKEVDSIGDAMVRMGGLGYQIVIDQIVTPDNIDRTDGIYLRINIPRTHGFRHQNEMEQRVNFNSPRNEYNFR